MTAPTGVSGQSKSALAALSASRQTVHIGHVESETQHATPSGIQKGIANCLSTFSGKLRGLIGGKRAKDVSESQPQPHIEQLSATGIQNNTGEGSEIHQAISDTAQILSKELGLDWDSESMSEILMDPKTIHAIIDKADSMANDISVIFGRLICLQHQIEPYENLALTLKEAGITHNDSQLEKLYAQGFKSETEVKDAVSTSQSFATKLAGHAKFKQAVRYALTERLDILSVHFQRHAMAKMLGITGMSESGISQFKNMLGKQVDLASQDQAGGSLRGVKVMTGSIRSTLNRVLSKRNAMTQLAKIADGEDGKKSSSFKAVRQLATIVRLAILEIMDTSAAPEDALADIQSGKLNDAILSKMTEFGLTDDHFSELGGNGISDMKGLISVETKEFKGAQSVKEWLTAAGMSGKMVRQLQRRESVENKREIANALPTTLAKRETESWLAGIGDGESLVINWGKKVSVGVPEGTKFVQEAFLSGQSLGGKVEVASKDMMLIEKSDKGFTLTIRESSLKSLSIQASFLFQAIKLEGKVGDGKSAGVKFEFATQKEASEFLTGIWTEQIDEESIESSDSVAFEKGKSVAVSGSAAIGSVKQVVAHFLPGLAEITDFIPDFGRTEATGRLNETVDGISTGNPLSAPAGLTMVNALLSKSDEKSDNLLSYSRGKSTEWTESRNIHGAHLKKPFSRPSVPKRRERLQRPISPRKATYRSHQKTNSKKQK